MELGRCPRCSRPYTASEVVGYGVLRSRAASAGGPRMEFGCPDCGRVIRLVPHGGGRYAPPGEPPPSWVPEAERRPPWQTPGDGGEERDTATEAPCEEAPAHAAEPDPVPPTWEVEQPGEVAMGPAEALALLGCKASAEPEEIERAFRERSKTCHPDKVAHLDEDFRALAEHKFKRLRRALDILRS